MRIVNECMYMFVYAVRVSVYDNYFRLVYVIQFRLFIYLFKLMRNMVYNMVNNGAQNTQKL